MRAELNNRQSIATLVIANFTAAVVAVGCGAGKDFPHPAVIVGYALLFSQVSLGAIWLGIGSNAVVVRLAAHVAILAAIYYGLSALHNNQGEWVRLLAVQTVAVAVPLAVGRWYGLRLQVTSSTNDEQPWQFTLKHLFLLTTACALLLGFLRLAPPWRPSGNRLTEALLLGGGFALMALIAAWVALGHGRRLFKLLALPVVTFLVGCLLMAIEGRRGRAGDLAIMALVFGQMFFLAGSLIVLRRCGYRLVRRGRR